MSKARDLADGTFDTDTLVVDAANNRVGIGTASPDDDLHILAATPAIKLEDTDGSYGFISANADNLILGADEGDVGASSSITFKVDGSERARIDSSGNLLVGKTTTAFGTAGVRLANTENYFTVDSSATADFNRLTNDGDIVKFYKDNSAKGSIGSVGTNLFVNSEGAGGYGRLRTEGTDRYIWSANTFYPAQDNNLDLGHPSNRYDDVYATNGTIQTSDANEKQDIAELDEAEKRVATAAKGLIRKFRWIDAVAEKGDDARIHVGVIAQDLQAAFEAEGLDAGRYAMFISSTWWEADEVIPAVAEELDEDGNVITEAQPERTEKRTYDTAEEAPEGAVQRTRLGVRYPELLAFIIGAL
jgi:hypothetical protein